MDYKIEFWNEDGQGSKKDLTDNVTGEILYPYSLGLTQSYYFNSDIEGTVNEILEEEANARGETYTVFTKTDKYYKYGVVCSDYQSDVLSTLNNHSHIFLTDEYGNETRIERVNFEVVEEFRGSKKVNILLLPASGRVVISGNF